MRIYKTFPFLNTLFLALSFGPCLPSRVGFRHFFCLYATYTATKFLGSLTHGHPN